MQFLSCPHAKPALGHSYSNGGTGYSFLKWREKSGRAERCQTVFFQFHLTTSSPPTSCPEQNFSHPFLKTWTFFPSNRRIRKKLPVVHCKDMQGKSICNLKYRQRVNFSLIFVLLRVKLKLFLCPGRCSCILSLSVSLSVASFLVCFEACLCVWVRGKSMTLLFVPSVLETYSPSVLMSILIKDSSDASCESWWRI